MRVVLGNIADFQVVTPSPNAPSSTSTVFIAANSSNYDIQIPRGAKGAQGKKGFGYNRTSFDPKRRIYL